MSTLIRTPTQVDTTAEADARFFSVHPNALIADNMGLRWLRDKLFRSLQIHKADFQVIVILARIHYVSQLVIILGIE